MADDADVIDVELDAQVDGEGRGLRVFVGVFPGTRRHLAQLLVRIDEVRLRVLQVRQAEQVRLGQRQLRGNCVEQVATGSAHFADDVILLAAQQLDCHVTRVFTSQTLDVGNAHWSDAVLLKELRSVKRLKEE